MGRERETPTQIFPSVTVNKKGIESCDRAWSQAMIASPLKKKHDVLLFIINQTDVINNDASK